MMRFRDNRKYFIIFMLLCLAGCSRATTLTVGQLEALKKEWQEPKVTVWYYMGSKEGFHYFCHHDLPGEKIYRVAANEMAWGNLFPFPRDRKQWNFLEWGFHDPVFQLRERNEQQSANDVPKGTPEE